MTSLASLLTHPLIRPLGWTLLHFLWQGAAVALLLAGALRLLRDQTANARYVAGCVALLLMAAAPGLTLLTLKPPPRASSLSSEFAQHPIDRLFVAKSPASGNRSGENAKSERSIRKPGNQEAAMPDFLVSWIPHQISGTFALSHFRAFATKYRSLAFQVRGRALERFIPVLVAAWLIGVCLLSVRLVGGWIAVQWLPRRGSRPITGPLAVRSAALARRLGIRRPVLLLEAAAVSVPMTLGWVRAVILVPVGALTGLPPAQLEALLVHELAHIRRHDYLVNLLQTAVETVLFYHPAVWWVSACIRVEREQCCDDLAVRALGDRLTYARALTAMETLRSAPPPLALAGSGGDLLARIRRILGLPPDQTGRTPAGLGGMMVLALLLATAALMRVSAAVPPPATAPPVERRAVAARAVHLKVPFRPSPPPARVPAHARIVSHGAVVARIQVADPHAVPARVYAGSRSFTATRPAHVQLASAAAAPKPRPAGSQPAGSKTAPSSGVVRGVSGQQIKDVAVLDLRGVPAQQVAQIRSLKDVAVVLLDMNNRGALRASQEDVGATVVAGPDLQLSVEPFLEISKAGLEAMPTGQKLLLVGIVAFQPDVPPALAAEKFASLQVTGVVVATAAVRGALLGKLQITGASVPLPDHPGPLVHSLGENTITADYLSRLSDDSIYLNIGETQIAPDVTEELLARKIRTYCNIGETAGPARLINLLKSRSGTNLGEFTETPAPAH